MKQELIDQWVEALTSGKHKQCQGMLENGAGERCCLGVLRYVVDPKDQRREVGMLTVSQLVEYGLNGNDASELAYMNDEGFDFDQIAVQIQAELGA